MGSPYWANEVKDTVIEGFCNFNYRSITVSSEMYFFSEHGIVLNVMTNYEAIRRVMAQILVYKTSLSQFLTDSINFCLP